MSDLYFDDLEDRSYTDEMVLADVQALVRSGQREGTVVDYKSDLSEQDNWPQTIAAFANTFGGLIIFGVEGKNDQPRRVTGYDPKGAEIKTKLTSMIVDRIQPRPDFLVRVVTLDKTTGKELALVRVSEGTTPPYVHSKGQENRVYMRIGAQKHEADYHQLQSLLEKRARFAAASEASPEQAFGRDSGLFVPRPVGSNLVSEMFLRFAITPKNLTAMVQLSGETERRFVVCVGDITGAIGNAPLIRTRNTTILRVSDGAYQEQRFGLSAVGATGFITYPANSDDPRSHVCTRGLLSIPTKPHRHLVSLLRACLSFLWATGGSRVLGSQRRGWHLRRSAGQCTTPRRSIPLRPAVEPHLAGRAGRG
jgi:hypothetical protein